MNEEEKGAAAQEPSQGSESPEEPASVVAEEAVDPTAVAPPPPPPPSAPAAPADPQILSQVARAPEERKALLANALQGQVASGGRIESQGEFQAVVVRGHRPNHLLHFLIGVFTLGLWWIIWFFIAVFGGEKRQMVSVDDFGNVLVQKV